MSKGLALDQVLRDLQTRAGKEVEELSQAQREKMREFEYLELREMLEGELSTAERAQKDELQGQLDLGAIRKANRDFLRKLDNLVRAGCGEGLARFLPRRRCLPLAEGERQYFATVPGLDGSGARRSCIEMACGTRSLEVPLVMCDGVRSHPTLHLAADQGSCGLPAMQFLLYHEGLRMTVTWDMFHRWHNDWLDSVATAGLTINRLEYASVCKLRQGPWSGQANTSILSSAAKEMSSLWDEHNLVFQLLYEDICAESEFLSNLPGIGSPEHIKAAWAWACNTLMATGCGRNTKTSRWWAWEQDSRTACRRRYLDILVLVFIGMRRRWWPERGENPLIKVLSPFADGGEDPLPGEAPGAFYDNDVGDAEADAAPSHDAPSNTKVSIAAGRSEVRRRRQQCVNILHFCCNLLLRQQTVTLWAVLSVIGMPLEQFCNEAITKVKTIRGVQAFHFELCAGALQQVAVDVLRHASSAQVAEAVGLTRKTSMSSTPYQRERLQVTMDKAFSLVVALAGNLLVTSCMYYQPPLCFIPLVNPDSKARQACLTRCRDMWESLLKLERLALSDKQCAAFVHTLQVSLDQFSREIFIRLSEVSFEVVPTHVSEDVREYSTSFLSSLVCEDAMNQLRATSSANRAGIMKPLSAYHCLSMGSKVVEGFGRSPMDVTALGRAASCGKIPTSVFDPLASACSLPTESLDALCDPKSSWPSLCPQVDETIHRALID